MILKGIQFFLTRSSIKFRPSDAPLISSAIILINLFFNLFSNFLSVFCHDTHDVLLKISLA